MGILQFAVAARKNSHTTASKEKTMPTKTAGQKIRRINVKKLKEEPKGLTAKEQKKVKGGGAPQPKWDASLNHNETLVGDSKS